MLGNMLLKSFINIMAKEICYTHGYIHNWSAPQIFAIETTNRCPMNCVMCPRSYGLKREIGDMDISLFKKIIDQIRPEYQKNSLRGTPRLLLHHYGEPVLYPYFREAIAYCCGKRIYTLLSTNPSLFTSIRAVDAIEAGLDEIRFMVDGMDEATIRAIRGPIANFTQGVENIKYIIQEKKKRKALKPKIVVAMLRQPANRHQQVRFLKFWGEFDGVDGIYLGFCHTQDGKQETIRQLSQQMHGDSEQQAEFKRLKIFNSFRCYYPWHSVCVLWDGKVVPCCHDSNGLLPLGDLNVQSLDEIWNGGPMQQLRYEVITGQLKNALCSTCQEANNEIGLPTHYPFFKITKWAKKRLQ